MENIAQLIQKARAGEALSTDALINIVGYLERYGDPSLNDVFEYLLSHPNENARRAGLMMMTKDQWKKPEYMQRLAKSLISDPETAGAAAYSIWILSEEYHVQDIIPTLIEVVRGKQTDPNDTFKLYIAIVRISGGDDEPLNKIKRTDLSSSRQIDRDVEEQMVNSLIDWDFLDELAKKHSE